MKPRNFRMLRPRSLNLLILALLLASFTLMAGCATTSPRSAMTTRADHCAGWKPIYPSGKDTLTDGTARQIKNHDCYGVRVGCWQPPTPKACEKQP